MAGSPVMTNIVAPVLKSVFEKAKVNREIPSDLAFRIVSEVLGQQGGRRYFCADKDGNPMRSLGYIDAKLTICG